MNIFEVLNTLVKEVAARPDFVRCPCAVCGGMVSTRTRMVPGPHGWYCTVASRDQMENRDEATERVA